MNEKQNTFFMNPYLAGFLVGLTFLASFLVLGTTINAGEAISRITAWLELSTIRDSFFKDQIFASYGASPAAHYMVFMLSGIFLGGFLSSLINGRIKIEAERGGRFPRWARLLLALIGGLLTGIGFQIARGGVLGVGLGGAALMQTSGVILLLSALTGAYISAWFFRRQWHD